MGVKSILNVAREDSFKNTNVLSSAGLVIGNKTKIIDILAAPYNKSRRDSMLGLEECLNSISGSCREVF